MVTEYIVKSEFGCAEKNDVFSYDKELNEYVMVNSAEVDGVYSQRSMCLSPNIAEEYCKSGLLSPTKDDNKKHSCGVAEAVKAEIAKLRNTYNQRKNSIEKKYADGKIQTCVKVEHDTVYFNLMKLLKRFEDIVDEQTCKDGK